MNVCSTALFQQNYLRLCLAALQLFSITAVYVAISISSVQPDKHDAEHDVIKKAAALGAFLILTQEKIHPHVLQ